MSQSGAFEFFDVPSNGIADVWISSAFEMYENDGVISGARTFIWTPQFAYTYAFKFSFLPDEVDFEWDRYANGSINRTKVKVQAKKKKDGISKFGVTFNGGWNAGSIQEGILYLVGNYGYIDPGHVYATMTVNPARATISTNLEAGGYKVEKTVIPISADEPIEVKVYADQMDKIEWLCPAGNLLVGTGGSEFIIGEATTAEPLGPNNVKVSPETAYGSSPIQARRIGSVLVFTQRAGRKLREFMYDYSGDSYQAADLTVASEHLTQGGLIDLAWQSEPIETLWAIRRDGQLLGFTYSKEQDMAAWHRHTLGGGGRVSHMAVIPAYHGGRDELWLSVAREVNGQTVYYIETLDQGYEEGQDPAEAFFVDCGLSIRGDSEFTVVGGLDHLEGLEVAILADGGPQPRQVVRQGSIELQYPAKIVQIGLPYDSVLTTLNFEMMLQDGTAQGRKKRIVKILLRLLDSLGGGAGPDMANLQELEFRRGRDLMDRSLTLFSGDRELSWTGGWETDGSLTVAQTHPLPFTLAAIVAELSIDGRN